MIYSASKQLSDTKVKLLGANCWPKEAAMWPFLFFSHNYYED
jgi:hypothetical protein